MSGNQQVDRAEMKKAADQIEAKHQAIHQLQSTLSGQINSLRAGWVGNASDAFYKAYTQFDGEFEKVKGGLEEIHGKLVDSQMSYSATEEEQSAAANPILGML
ncbi:WXG100 family type VII secretion target [Aestuariimicrobium ganziense]|uniref:WXG100 family type VII secretion target n=1 Tax=Aestuariimicrobium ganziense TaxID=2773677 RepID=UPI00194054F7|nr:WXG100 family type VII secretion target [Aestuariimicrobium ganziense]